MTRLTVAALQLAFTEDTAANIQAVADSDDIDSVISAMERREVRRVPVTDGGGKLVGIIAQADIANCDDIPRAQVGEVVQRVSEPNR